MFIKSTNITWLIWFLPPSTTEQNHHHHHVRFTALLLGPPGSAGARRELLDFMVQGKINRGRYTDHPTGRHSSRTNQCPPPPSPSEQNLWRKAYRIFHRPDALCVTEPTVSEHVIVSMHCRKLRPLVRLAGWLEFNIPFQHKYGYIKRRNWSGSALTITSGLASSFLHLPLDSSRKGRCSLMPALCQPRFCSLHALDNP